MSCNCTPNSKLIFSCSGAADVGAVADQAARKLTRDGVGKMFCLAGIGGKVSNILKTTQGASSILAIDGCPLSCAKKTLEEAGFTDFIHFELSSINLAKGATELDDNTISMVTNKCNNLLQTPCK